MGEVYLAEDLHLRRKVALKVLPEDLAVDLDRLRRFEREAQSASALNHPNIVTVHEFGADKGIHFLVTELVEGVTLREKIKNDDLTLAEILDIAQQAAFALSAAHSAGIIHRDIKPENIMVRDDGIVKVLDFGLAKLTGPVMESIESEADTLVQMTHQTKPGVIVGTLHYMSPEQIRGQVLEVRTDIFSLGVVIYEMITGVRPFNKPTSIDVIAAILTENPPPLAHESRQVTPELQRVVSKSLSKDRDERYQSSRELLADLKSLLKEIEFSSSRERTAFINQAQRTDEVEAHKTTTAKRRRFSMPTVIAMILAAGLAVSAIWWLVIKGNSRPMTVNPALLESSVVANWQSSPGEGYSVGAFSPDGKMIAFTSTKIGSKNIWVKRLSGGEAVQVTKDEFANQSPVWSSSSEEIAFYSIRGGTPGIWRIPAFGGAPTFIKSLQDSRLVLKYWSKKDVIYYEAKRNLFALELKSGQASQLTNLDANKVTPNTISISPDEERIAYVSFENDRYAVSTMPLRGGLPEQIVLSPQEIKNAVWHPDSKRIFYSALTAGIFQVFVTDIDGSAPSQITFGDKDSLVLDISADGTRILSGSSKEESDVWTVQVANGSESALAADIDSELWPDVSPDNKTVAYQAISNLSQGNNLFSGAIVTKAIASDAQAMRLVANAFLPTWSPDATQLAFMRVSGETYNLWTIKAVGGAEKQLTTSGVPSIGFSILPYNRTQTSDFSWSPDGRKIAYVSEQSGVHNIWLVDANDASTKQLTNNTDANEFLFCPLWSADGKRLAYASKPNKAVDGNSFYTASMIEIETGSAKRIIQSKLVQRLLGWSPSGQELIMATLRSEAGMGTPTEVSITQVNCQTGVQRQLAQLAGAYFYNLHLSADKKMIAYVSHQGDKDDVWVMTLDSSEKRRLTSNNDPRLYYSSLSWSPDGRTIYFGKQKRYSLLSMISNFK